MLPIDGRLESPMPKTPSNHDELLGAIVRREKFTDGSECVEFKNGSIMILEANLAKTAMGSETPVSYGESVPDIMEMG